MPDPGYLDAVRYPAGRSELIAAATAAGAPPEFIDRLENLSHDRYDDADTLGRELARSRASSNPANVAITPEPCPNCGFLRVPGEEHSCIEAKARFADTVRGITDEFEIPDESSRPPG